MDKLNLTLVTASVKGVLGEYDHSITIDKNDKFVIIYGPNGVGKTKFLEIVNALSRLQGDTLAVLPFDTATLIYSDGSELSVKFEGSKRHKLSELDSLATRFSSRIPVYTLKRPNQDPICWKHEEDDFTDFLERSDRYDELSEGYWVDLLENNVYEIEELREKFKGRWRRRPGKKNSAREQASEFTKQVPIFLIETQRLRAGENAKVPSRERFRGARRFSRSESRINKQAAIIQSRLDKAQTEHSRITQQLDRTFPNRVLGDKLQSDQNNGLNEQKVRLRYDEQNDFRSRLGQVASVSLDNELSLPGRTLDEWDLKLLNQYLEDTDKKFEPFIELLKKIELLEEIINNRLLNKKLKVTSNEGLLVEHAKSSRKIPLQSLSSGEQHEIILMIDLLFNVPKGGFVLIDEPEISLHVVWQISFIPDVNRIAELAGFKFIVATHSPQIIHDQWNHAIRLGPEEAPFDA